MGPLLFATVRSESPPFLWAPVLGGYPGAISECAGSLVPGHIAISGRFVQVVRNVSQHVTIVIVDGITGLNKIGKIRVLVESVGHIDR